MGRSYDTGIDVRTCAYIRRPFWHLSIIPLLKGRAKSPRLFKNLNLAAQVRFQFPIRAVHVICLVHRKSIYSLFGNRSRNTLFFYPSKSIAIIPLLLRAISPRGASGLDSNAVRTQSSFELRDKLRSMQ